MWTFDLQGKFGYFLELMLLNVDSVVFQQL